MPANARKSIVILVVAALILIPFVNESAAQEPYAEREYTAEKMTADILLVRPVGIVATVFGAAVFVVSLPFSLLGGNTGAAYENLIVEPARFTFKRPLGDI